MYKHFMKRSFVNSFVPNQDNDNLRDVSRRGFESQPRLAGTTL